MADPKKRLPGNVAGSFFVDSTCENCDICRQLAPEIFADGAIAVVKKQPSSADEIRRSMHAIICCPLGSIGCDDRKEVAGLMADFPIGIAAGVYFCGFNSIRSAGGHAYFLQTEHGNWLVNSPKFVPSLVKKFEELGGVDSILLTHRDDVGECAQYGKHFGAKRYIQYLDREAQPDAECIFTDRKPFSPQENVLIIPTPGHTEGHCMFLFKTFLVTGDTLYFDRHNERLELWNPTWTWCDFDLQTESVKQLLNYEIEWVLPVHGQRVQLKPDEFRRQLADAIERAKNHPLRNVATNDRKHSLAYYVRELEKLGQHEYAHKMQMKLDEVTAQLTADSDSK